MESGPRLFLQLGSRTIAETVQRISGAHRGAGEATAHIAAGQAGDNAGGHEPDRLLMENAGQMTVPMRGPSRLRRRCTTIAETGCGTGVSFLTR
jgi:hypothetical protein